MPAASDDRHLAYRAHLDGLRAVAVLLVIAFHAGFTVVPGGFVGVDVFFVLSGYLITRILVSELGGGDRVRLGRFYARRMRRLLPASALALGGITYASHHLLDRAQQLPVAGDVRWAALWSANWRFVQARTDYFAPGDVPSPVVHYWSLAVEEQFYLVWPALLLGLWLLLSRGRARPSGPLLGAVGALALASAVASVLLTPGGAAYYGTHTRAYQLLAGALLALVVVRREHATDGTPALPLLRASTAALAGLGGLVGIGLLAWRTDGAGGYPGWPAIAVTVATLVTVASLEVGASGPLHRVLGATPVSAVGRVSYSLYLWHWPVLVFAPLLAERWERAWIDDRPVTFGLMALFAVASYVLFERPIRFRLAPGAPALAVVATGIAVSIVVAVAVADRLQPQSDDEAVALAAVTDLAKPGHCPYFTREWPAAAEDAEPCVWRDGGPYTVALVGDSHAQMWLPALDEVAERYDLTVVRVTRGGCPANDITPFHLGETEGSRVPDDACAAWRRAVYPKLISEVDPDLVIVSTRSHVLGIEDEGRFLLRRDEGHLERWTAGYERTLGWLGAGGAQVVVSQIVPTLPERVPACLAEQGLGTDRCDWPVSVDHVVPRFNEVIRGFATSVPGTLVVDPTPLACPGGTCTAVVDGVVVHRDDNHLSATYAATLGRRFEALLRAAGARLPTA